LPRRGGGRGTGAAANALATKSGPIKLVAMADVFEHRLKSSYETLTSIGGDAGNGSPDRAVADYDPAQVDVPPTGGSSGSTPTRRRWTA
jgi:hypothetical protein